MSDFFFSPPRDFNSKMTVVTCAFEYESTILFLKRAPNCLAPLTWCVPGGKLKFNEQPKEALIREIHEELSINIPPQSVSEALKIYVRHSLMDYILYVYHSSLTTLPEIFLNPNEHTDFLWQPIKEINNLNLLEGQEVILSMLLPFYSNTSQLVSSSAQTTPRHSRRKINRSPYRQPSSRRHRLPLHLDKKRGTQNEF
jgi:8-oxo-dGTP diphosphatase